MSKLNHSTKIYLDNCCYNRPFDQQDNLRVHLESLAKLELQSRIRDGEIQMVWSYILDYEVSKIPFQDRREAIEPWYGLASQVVTTGSDTILESAHILQNKYGFKKYDALHVACAISAGCDYFVTTDDKLLKSHVTEISIVNPIDLI